MRIIIFSWEFPPRIVGQLSHYVNRLAVELVKKRVDVYVVTYHDYWIGLQEGSDGVKAYRVSSPVKAQASVLTWDLILNQELERAAADIYYSVRRKVDLIDAHDWHFIPATVSLKKAFHLPFIFSVDSLENHRSHRANTPFNLAVKSLEWLGAYESARIVVKSDWMKQEVSKIYNAISEKIDVVSPYSPDWIDEVLKVYKKAIRTSPNLENSSLNLR